MDRAGKDTYKFKHAGAREVLISNAQSYCLQGQLALNEFSIKQTLIDNDFVLVEGHKKSKLPKLLMYTEELWMDYQQGLIENVCGVILPTQQLLETDLPVFDRNDVLAIYQFILNFFKPAPLKALILAGGKSTRMGKDKGAINYHGDFQTVNLHNRLSQFVDEVYISARKDQLDLDHLSGMKTITDVYPSAGPIAGILSAMNKDSNAAWLVVAVDLPYLDHETIEQLISNRNHLKMASCFENPVKKWPEPLCTIWEPKSKLRLHHFMGMDRNCPRKILFNSEINLLKLSNKLALDNCNTYEEYKIAKKYFEVTL
jgi:molybdopterin-guanine dinucleotide biosynthesis protein A